MKTKTNNMKEIIKITKEMVKENYLMHMKILNMKVNLKKEKKMEKV